MFQIIAKFKVFFQHPSFVAVLKGYMHQCRSKLIQDQRILDQTNY